MSIIPTITDERGRYTRGSFALILCLMIATTTWRGAGGVYAWANDDGFAAIEAIVQDSEAAKQRSAEDAARAMEEAARQMSEGRRLIDQQKWELAAERFNALVGEFPAYENVDAAMYWLAYSLNKAGVYEDADLWAKRLLEEHLNSTWKRDAEALRVQIAAEMRDTRRVMRALRAPRPARAPRAVVAPMPPMPPQAAEPALAPEPPAAIGWGPAITGVWDMDFDFDFDFDFDTDVHVAGMAAQEDGNDEGSSDDQLKCVALQGLFESNPERAIAAAGNILKAGSTSSPRVKRCAALFLGQSDSPQARPILVGVARNNGDVKLQKYAIIALAQNSPKGGHDDTTISLFRELATTSQDESVAKAAVYALSQDESPRTRAAIFQLATSAASPDVRKYAVFYLGQSNDPAALDDLLKVYQSTQDIDLKKRVIHSISQVDSPRTVEVLKALISGTQDPKLRRTAIWAIAQRDCSPTTVGALMSMYRESKELEVQSAVVDALGQCEESASTQALIEIAKSAASVELRKKAVFWIGQRKDPAAQKFLEELVTQP